MKRLILNLFLLLAAAACSRGPVTLTISSEDGRFMTFSGASQSTRPDWIFPLEEDTLLVNHLGQNDRAYGGGIPLSVVWTAEECIALGSLSPVPLDINIPVEKKGNTVTVTIDPLGEKMPKLFIYKGKGDCFRAFKEYAKAMEKRGIVPAGLQPASLETQWCGWGYGKYFTPEEILGTLPKIKEMGITWVCVDDGFQTYRGGVEDWKPKRWPESEMKAMADSIRAYGLKPMIWWFPMGMSPKSKFVKEHPEVVAKDSLGRPYPLSHGCIYVSPTHPLVIEEARALVRMFMKDWGYDALKLDGHQMNSFPANYANAGDPMYDAHHVTDFYKAIYEEALAINPDAVVQYCPCGDVFSIYHLPYLNQTVSSDPENHWQVRSKAYVLKALAPNVPYYGDHVEIVDGDFDSQFAVGSVPGTKFTWPADNPRMKQSSLLTPEKEPVYKRAFEIYEAERQSEGELLGGLYNLGFDVPEAYVIRKGDTFYYSFFAPEFEGQVEFRGLSEGSYAVEELWNGALLGEVCSEDPHMNLSFKESILLKLIKK
ncbi:MAG: alpha-galactosidase [Bacteroidales bacterium]|nr:alpha-galactosidase [Bacteroidales bacterium]